MNNTTLFSRMLSAGALTAATLSIEPALAVPREGDVAPNARVEDADGRALELRSLKDKPILIVYEDRDSATQNQALKDELSVLARGDRYKKAIALAAVADVSSYDFWPVKGFVRDAIRDESKKQKTTIYCDWTGSFRAALKLRRGMSNVVLVGRSGRVLFAAEGPVPAAGRKRLVELLKGEIEGRT